MDSNTNNTQELLKKGRILALKIFAESFLLGKGNKKTEELFADKEINNKTELNGGEVYVLHNWLLEEYREMGLDLAKAIVSNGERLEDNKLSNYEIKELIKRADKLILQLSVFKSYVKANHK